MVMDSNGAFYISDHGCCYDDYGETPPGFVLRVSPTGVVSKVSPPDYWVSPGLMTANEQGDIYVEDGNQRSVYELAAWTGDYTQIPFGTQVGGLLGTNPQNLAVDASNTLYFWDSSSLTNIDGMAYTAPNEEIGPDGTNFTALESLLPLYTIPPISDYNNGGGEVPFFSAFGNQTMTTSVSGKLYVVNGAGPGVFLVDRTQGRIPEQAFNPNPPFYGGTKQAFFIYNVGNQNATFTDPTRTFTESGNGIRAFTFSVPPPPPPPLYPGGPIGEQPCQPGTVIPPGGYCAIYVTNTNWPNKGPMVTDTLHFLTNAVNNNSVSFQISGVANPAP